MATLTDINGIGPALAVRLTTAGFSTVNAVASATPADLAQLPGLSETTAAKVIAEAKNASAPAVDSEVDDLRERVSQLEAAVAKLKKQLTAKTPAKPAKSSKKGRKPSSKKRKKKKKK